MSTWMVTLSALAQYAGEAVQARATLNEANEQMKRAAEELCSVCKGDSVDAFAQEQGVLSNHVIDLMRVGEELIAAVQKALQIYEEQLKAAADAIRG